MPDQNNDKDNLRKLAEESMEVADKITEEDFIAFKKATLTDLNKLKLKVTDPETYQKLIAVVNEAITDNLSTAELQDRLKQLGATGMNVFKEAVEFLRNHI